MMTPQFDPPLSEEIEISVFGPEYGEAVALHIGEGKWVLVDSCVEPESELPASLHYLRNLNVQVENAVKMIVATHWHDDHIRGIGTVLSECTSATVSLSSALRNEELIALAELYDKPVTRRGSGISEFIQVLRILDARKNSGVRFGAPKLALADTILFRDGIHLNDDTIEVRLFSLSPSPASVLRAHVAFAGMWKEQEPRKRVASIQPNPAAVVLWIEAGHHRVLLGSDLETTSDPTTGWSVILNESMVVSGQASVFKIPHHGSETAHHKEVWSKLLSSEPFAVLTPFRLGGTTLPTSRDILRICALTSRAYATSPPRRRQQRWHDGVVRDLVEGATKDIRDVHCGWGHVRLRNSLVEVSQSWQVELFGDAYLLDPDRERRFMRDTRSRT